MILPHNNPGGSGSTFGQIIYFCTIISLFPFMQKHLTWSLLSLLSCTFFACKPKETPVVVQTLPAQSEMRQCHKQRCVQNNRCANYSVMFPQFSGGDPVAMKAISEMVHGFILSYVGGNNNLPFEVALDSAGIQFCEQFLQDQKENPGMELGYDLNLTSNLLVNNPKIMTVELACNNYTGGAHPTTTSNLATFDIQNKGKVVPVTAMITDTTAVLPMLEKAYKASKGMSESGNIGDLLYSPASKLTLPQNVCVIKEGIRFFYNEYEVAPYAVGSSDVTLTWEQLGALADRKKWFD
jgi:hypothetical protein